jgi:hypothetical protein
VLLRIAADLIVLVHFAFVIFVVAGGLLALKWPKMAYLHIPAAVWGAWIGFANWICPLTPLENHLRRLVGEAGYAGGFIEHYITRILYPAGLTAGMRVILGIAVVAANLLVYRVYFARRRSRE